MATDFFDREAHAQKLTRRLYWLFQLTVLAMLVINNLLLASVVYVFAHPTPDGMRFSPIGIIITILYLFGEALVHPVHFLRLIWDPWVAVGVSIATLCLIGAGCWYKIRQLAGGGPAIAEMLGGRRVSPSTTDPDEQRLRNVTAEMSIAAGVPIPEIYLLDNERGINAFAAGHTRDDVAIGVTRGCLKLLTRDELQGVIAHEFSHILTGDTRLNTRLIILAHGLFWPTLLGRALCYGTSDEPAPDSSILVPEDRAKMLPTAVIGFFFILMGSISLPFVRLIKSAICRQREWMADAAAVQFTRNPAGIAGALKKIGGLVKRGRLDTPSAEMASHLYFVESGYESWLTILCTHPPLFRRLAAIDPAFNGIFPRVQMLAPNEYERDQAFDQAIADSMAINRVKSPDGPGLGGVINADHILQASLLRVGLPAEVTAALRTPAGAVSVICALLMSDDDDVQARQMGVLRKNLQPQMFQQTAALIPPVKALGDRYRLVLAEFAVPALREYNSSEHDALHQNMQELIECDGSIGLFEYMLMKLVARQLRARLKSLAPEQYGRVQDLIPECALLLSALAHVGQDTEADARAAFARGVEFLDAPMKKPEFLPRDQWDLGKVDAAITRIAQYHEPIKRNVLMACARTVSESAQVGEREAELLHAIADSFDCPVPPFIESQIVEQLAE